MWVERELDRHTARQGVVKRMRILVVEDDTALANMYRASLRLAGFDAATAHDGFTALSSIDADRPDLIVLDLHLPCVHGAAILEDLAARPETATIPVVIVTGSDITAAVAQAKAVLRKPCDPELLLAAVEHTLRAA